MHAFDGMHPYFGDLHNHCGISYGHGSLETALRIARQQLDFCSVTGHASWPDMPAPNKQIQHLLTYHPNELNQLKMGLGPLQLF